MKITTKEQLNSLYPEPGERALKKVLTQLEQHSLHFIQRSPFILLSTFNAKGELDISPKGGEAGFVKVLDNSTLAIPDLSGNNRIDNLKNIVETGRIGTIFLIPGIDETLRVNGKAFITADTDILTQFDTDFKPPKCCIVLEAEEIFLHCAKAFMRSDLWGDTYRMDPENFPSMGQMLKDQLKSGAAAESRSEMTKRYQDGL